jgi:uncharacterized lipoprotein YbaY
MKTRFLLTLAGATALALAGCSGGSSNSNAPTTNTTSTSSSPLVQSQVYAQQKIAVSSLNSAVQQYHAAEGHFPANLQELAPNYIEKVPQAPAGYTINYDANNGAVSMAKQ